MDTDKDKRIKVLEEALQALVDCQNGPPLIWGEKEWERAMKKAIEALNPS